MILVRILVNALIMAGEIAAVAGIAWVAYRQPVAFAGMTALVALVLGLRLEYDRIRFEFPFYFERMPSLGHITASVMAFVEAGFRALLAGVVALLTFSGTEPQRILAVAFIFAVCVWIGAVTLRRLSISLSARASRWGYFRLAAPLGLVFSAALTILPVPTLADVGRRLIFDLPARPSVTQASEALFIIKQKFDELVVALLTVPLGPEAARIVGVFASVNVLTGFVVALYALIIAETVRWLEVRSP